MGCKECGKPKCNGKCGCKSPKVLQINNPAEYITFHKVSIPAAMGDSTTNHPKIGAYRNALVYYEADHTSWMYSTDGIPTLVTGEKGDTGDTGPQGPAGTITIGTTTTGETGTDAEVENVGTPENAILNFTIPRGEQGDQGIQGEPGPQGYMNEQDVRDVVDTIVPEGFFDDESTVSDCGTSFELENLAGGSPKSLRLNGDTFQQSYTGKNLLGASLATMQSENTGGTWSNGAYTHSGVTVTPVFSNGLLQRIELSGTATSNFTFIVAKSYSKSEFEAIVTAGETYTLSGCPSGGSSTTYYLRVLENPYKNLYTDTGEGITKQMPSISSGATQVRLVIGIDSGTNTTGLVYRPQFEKSASVTAYEPYCGGVPSPNPDYPQAIQTVTGEQTVEIVGKNLIDPSQAVLGTIDASTGDIVPWSGDTNMAGQEYIPVKPNTAYTLSVNSSWYFLRLSEYTADKANIQRTQAASNTYLTITTTANTHYLRWSANPKSETITNPTAMVNSGKMQLELGSTATSYSAYSKQTLPISLGSIELCKLGTYQDYIYKDGDNWKVHKEIGHEKKIVSLAGIDGYSSVYGTATTPNGAFAIINTNWGSDYDTTAGLAIASSVIGVYQSQNIDSNNTANSMIDGTFCQRSGTNDRVYFRFASWARSKTVDEVNQMVTDNGGIDLWYPLTTTTDTTITDTTLIAQLEAIRLDTGVNAISIFSDGLSGEICLEAFIGNWKGTISELKNADDRLEEKLGNLPYGDKSQSVVYAFFNEANDGTFDFYTSEDGIELQKLNVEHTLTGRDPAPFFKNGKWYVASTSYNYVNGYDFAIRVSDDLNNWTLHNISVGLTEQDYPKVWAPEWFEDDDGKIYIILSKMYANTEGWGDFHPYIVECTDLENLTFGAPQQMILNGSTSDNHIDGAIAKYNGTYHLIIKSDHQSELYLEHYTSADLVNWTLQDVDPMRFGRTVEGPFIYKRDGYYYIGAERYSTRPMELSYYIMCKTKDFVTYSPCEDISFPDADVSHGSGIVVDNAEINKLLNTGLVTKESGSKVISEIPVEKDFDVVATRFADLSVSPNVRLGAYLHMFDIKAAGTYHNGAVIFHISTVFGTQVDATYKLNYYNANSSITDVKFSESDCLTADIHEPMSVAGSMFAIKKPNDPTVLQVFLETDRITKTNQRLDIKFISTILDHAQIIKYVDDFVDSVPDGEMKHYARGSAKSQSVNFDNKTHPYIRITFGSYNGGIRLYGHENSLTNIHRLVDAMILVNNGGGAIHHLNSEYDGNIDITVENYTSSDTDRKREYQVLISGIPTNSALTFTLPNNMYSYIKKVQYLDSI